MGDPFLGKINLSKGAISATLVLVTIFILQFFVILKWSIGTVIYAIYFSMPSL